MSTVSFDNVVQANAKTLQVLGQGNRVIVHGQDSFASLDIFSRFSLVTKDSQVMVYAGEKLQFVDASTITKDSEIVMKVTFTSVGNSNFQGALSLANATRRKLEKSYFVGLTLDTSVKNPVLRPHVIGVSNGGDKWTPEKSVMAWGVEIGIGKLAMEAKSLLTMTSPKRAWKWNRDTQNCEIIPTK